MADSGEIIEVRNNTNELTEDPYTDSIVSDLIDEIGLAGASAKIWRWKAARYAELVDTSEGGTTEKFSDLHRSALKMIDYWDGLTIEEEEVEVEVTSGTRIQSIQRGT